MSNVGFDKNFGLEAFRDWSHWTEEEEEAHTVNYFGIEDFPLLAPMFEHIDKAVANDQPFFTTFLTTIQHDGNVEHLPKLMNVVDYSDDAYLNAYLNSVKYADDLLRNMTEAVAARNLSQETLFVVMGDHGAAFHEHNMMTTYNLQYDEALRVPVCFYTENRYDHIFPFYLFIFIYSQLYLGFGNPSCNRIRIKSGTGLL